MAKIYGGRWQLVDGRNSGGAGRHELSRQGLIGRAFAGICAQKNDAAAGRSGRVVGAPKRGSGEQDWTAQVASRSGFRPFEFVGLAQQRGKKFAGGHIILLRRLRAACCARESKTRVARSSSA
jgi:hypothetical protein